jgi:glucose/mannose-6-phosphate isomerase
VPRAAAGADVLVCGRGGSAIGGDFAAAWAAPHGVRIAVHRTYGLPAWLDRRTLVLFSSYSGNTEETLAAFDASSNESPRACITTGGMLAARATGARLACCPLPPGLQPRAALGHSLVAVLAMLHACGVVPDPGPDLAAAAAHLRELWRQCAPQNPEAQNPAKRLARRWRGRLPVVYTGTGCTAPVGVRWRGQIAENAKQLATHAVFPELDHNEIMAWTALPDLRRHAVLTILRDRDDQGPVARRMQITAEILSSRVGAIEWIETAGSGVLERILGAAFLGDLASVYLSFLNGVDPTPVAEIETLKAQLARA